MFGLLISSFLVPLAMAAPTKRASQLNCVRYQYSSPFDSFGQNGKVHLYANVTQWHPDSQSTSFEETRLGIDANGELEPCGDCRTTQLFAFEVCETPEGTAFDEGQNSAENFYGHIKFTHDGSSWQCLEARNAPGSYNGSAIAVADCEYDFDNVGASGQYWKISNEQGVPEARLVTQNAGETWGVDSNVSQDEPTRLWGGPSSGPFTYLGFKAPI